MGSEANVIWIVKPSVLETFTLYLKFIKQYLAKLTQKNSSEEMSPKKPFSGPICGSLCGMIEVVVQFGRIGRFRLYWNGLAGVKH